MITQGSIALLTRFLTAYVVTPHHLVFNDMYEVDVHYEELNCEIYVKWGHNIEQSIKPDNTFVLCNYGMVWQEYDLEIFVESDTDELMWQLQDLPSDQLMSDFKQFQGLVKAIYEEDLI